MATTNNSTTQMKNKLLLLCLVFSSMLYAQQYTIKGRITETGIKNEGLIGANVVYGDGQGTVADVNGYYSLTLPAGKYEITFSYVGYKSIVKKITLNGNVNLNVELETSALMKEVMVVADVAIARKTPVAFSNITPKAMEENLASQDIPMVLNATPGVYATQEGGGEGDAQVTIRGFSSRNVGVLLDGVPVNDMENGHVYWSNWFGLDAVTRSMQVQRGLGASKLALPSVGGTINIITKGMENQRGGQIKQEVGSYGMTRTSFGYNTGALNNGWGFSLAGSYKQGDGYVTQTPYSGFFWYGKIDKRIGSHTISLSGYGAPQEHAQRSYKLPVAVYDSAYAESIGVKLHYSENYDPSNISEEDQIVKTNRAKADEGIGRGIRYNQHWGYLARTYDNPNATPQPFSERVNQYHKPQFTLKDSWQVNRNLFISNILYASIGNGGGIRAGSSSWTAPNKDGLIDFQSIYDSNRDDMWGTPADGKFGTTNGYMRRMVNSHRWYGLLSTANYVKGRMSYSGGLDLRYYKGIHYQEVYDLLGADYVERSSEEMMPGDTKDRLYVGDKTYYHNDGLVRWGGVFFQSEYKTDKLAAFINITGALSSYNRIDYMSGITSSDDDPDFVPSDRLESGWNSFPGFTAKGGANYNMTENMNVFVNLGLLNKAPRFNNVYDLDNTILVGIKNEKVQAFELGYSYHSQFFAANINSYYTEWKDRPVDKSYKISTTNPETGELEDLSANINGMDALHKGVELDFVVNIHDKFAVQGLVSLGDWKWNSADTARIYSEQNELVGLVPFDAKGVHVGNSAQTQYALELRWEPIKYLYFKPRATVFDRYYAEFNPMNLKTPKDSWMIPRYALLDLHTGYSYKYDQYLFSLRFNVLNALDATYIATAQNNDSYNGEALQGYDARSASVFMGLGRRYNISLQVKF